MKSKLLAKVIFTLVLFCLAIGAEAGAREKRKGLWSRLRARKYTKREVPKNAPVIAYKKFAIEYAVRDTGVGVGLRKVELYLTTDLGVTWKLYGEDPDHRSPFIVGVEEDGVYGFALVSIDSVGNSERPPFAGMFPEKVIIVDSVAPEGVFLSPAKRVAVTDGKVEISWKTTDKYPSLYPVRLQYSADGGKIWHTFKRRQTAAGTIKWTPPTDKAAAYSLRMQVKDRAGNKVALRAGGIIVTDSVPPSVRITGPNKAQATSVNLTYTLKDNEGGSGVDWVELWVTADGGQTWELYGRDREPGSPFKYINKNSIGEAGFVLRASDKVGNVAKAPTRGVKPDISLVFDTKGPEIELQPFADGRRFIRGGSRVKVIWQARDANMAANSVTLSWSADGGQTWETLAEERKAADSYVWQVPGKNQKDMNNCIFKVSAVDTLGNTGFAVTPQPFTIVSRPPKTEFGLIKQVPGKTVKPERVVVKPLPKKVEPVISIDKDKQTAKEVVKDTLPAVRAKAKHHPSDLEETRTSIDVPPLAVDAGEVIKQTPALEVVAKPKPLIIPAKPLPPVVIEQPVKEVKQKEIPKEVVMLPAKPVLRKVEKTESFKPVVVQEEEKIFVAKPIKKLPRKIETPVVVPDKVKLLVSAAGTKQAEQLLKEAWLSLQEKEYLQARLRASEALALDKDLSRAHLVLGIAKANEGKLEEAVKDVEQAIALDNKDALAFKHMGDISFTLGKKAQNYYRRGRSAAVSAPESDLKKLREKITRNLRNALSSYNYAAKLKPDVKELHDKLGEVYYYQAKNAQDKALMVSSYRDAVEAFETGYELGQPNYKEVFHLGVIHFRLNEPDAAVRYFKQGIEVSAADEKPKECYWYLAEIATARNHLDDALTYWRMTANAYATDNPRDREFRKLALKRAQQINLMLENQ